MRGAVLYEPNTALVIEDLELPDIGPGHVRVRLVPAASAIPTGTSSRASGRTSRSR